MLKRSLLAFAIGAVWAVTHVALAHEHPAPTDCPSTCIDRQCKCVDSCNKMGSEAGAGCFKDCYDQKQDCLSRCATQSIAR